MLSIGIGCSNALMSWGGIGLAISFIWQGKFKEKAKLIWSDKRIVSIVFVYFLFVIGMIYTSNFSEGLHQLKIKLPLLIIPLGIFSFYPLTQKEFKLLFHGILMGGLISIVVGILVYFGIITKKSTDVREYSYLISHIRLSTLLVFNIFMCCFVIVNKKYRYVHFLFYIVYIILSLLSIILLQSITAFITIGGCILVLSIYSITKKTYKKYGIALMSFFLILFITTIYLFYTEYNRIHKIETFEYSQLPKLTPDGGTYVHLRKNGETINGHYVFLYICYPEIKEAWEKRSKIPITGMNRLNWSIYEGLIRYLTSKNKPKNKREIEALSQKEITAIENGSVNFLQLNKFDIRYRINLILWELDYYTKTGDPNYQSLSTRLEIWKVATYKIKQSWLFGYGTGDMKAALSDGYKETQSTLLKKNQLDPHQQYLVTLLCLGVIGLIPFIILIFYPVLQLKNNHFLFIIVLTITMVSMMDEDVLNSQAGCTQFVLTYVLTYIFSKAKREKIIS